MEVRAVAKNIRRSPKKVRMALDTVRGKSVDEAIAILRFLPHGAAPEILSVVKSAAANAENNFQMAPEDLYIKKIFADEGGLGRLMVDTHCAAGWEINRVNSGSRPFDPIYENRGAEM